MTPDDDGQDHADRAVTLMIERGLVGWVWLDDKLTVRRRRGPLTDWIGVGLSHEDALPMLVGYEARLRELRARPAGSEVIPNVGMPDGYMSSGGAVVAKLDVQAFWLPTEREYLIVLQHESSHGALQLELHQEIASRQQAESREAQLARDIRRTNEELTRANRDLESFAYIISHDLRAPLRAMRITADQLGAELNEQITPEAQEKLARIRILSRRMGAMMSGLLEYARVGRKQEAIAPVDTARLVGDIIVGIGAPETLHVVREGTWPVISSLAEPLDVVLRNLIENAVKHHDTKVGSIRLHAHDDGESIRFDVTDDGPGIDPEYHDAIFEPFRTVSGEETAESSGIGLALVKKTAEIVGGRIEVVSDPAQRRGTTFRLFWPKILRGL